MSSKRRRKHLDLGKTLKRGAPRSLPNELAARRLAVFGISGSGKSNTATVILEGLIRNGEQVVLVDPKGEGWGLRVGRNGKPAGGLDVVVFGEPRGDLPLREEHAGRVADFVVDTGQSVVLSLQGFDTDAAERRFVAGFMERLYRRKSKQANPIRTLVALEEAHLFVPEAGRVSGDVAHVVSSIRRIGRQGRSAGLGLMVIDQRPADVANSVITQSELLICHQLAHKSDRDALRGWVKGYDREGQGEHFLETVAQLEPGEAWVWSPAWLKVFDRVQVRLRDTFDSGHTPDGSRAKRDVRLAPVDLDQLRGQLEEVVQAAEASDPERLRRELVAAQRNLERVTAERDRLRDQPRSDPAELEHALAAERERVTDELTAAWQGKLHAIYPRVADVSTAWETLADAGDAVTAIDTGLRALFNGQAPRPSAGSASSRRKPKPATSPSGPAPAAPKTPTRRASSTASVEGFPLGERHRGILDTIAWWNSVGVSPDWNRIAALRGFAPTTTSWKDARRDLWGQGLIDRDYAMSDAARGAAQQPDRQASLADLHDAFRRRMNERERALFDSLLARGGTATWDELSEEHGFAPTTTSWKDARRSLARTFGLVRIGGGKLTATDLMYPEGLK